MRSVFLDAEELSSQLKFLSFEKHLKYSYVLTP